MRRSTGRNLRLVRSVPFESIGVSRIRGSVRAVIPGEHSHDDAAIEFMAQCHAPDRHKQMKPSIGLHLGR